MDTKGSVEPMTEAEEKARHDRYCHKGADHRHFCKDWDFMFICELCDEFKACLCHTENEGVENE